MLLYAEIWIITVNLNKLLSDDEVIRYEFLPENFSLTATGNAISTQLFLQSGNVD